MSESLPDVFQQVVAASTVFGFCAAVMREFSNDRMVHICSRILGASAYLAVTALAYFSVHQYVRLEQVLIVRAASKVAEPVAVSQTEMELPSGIRVAWTNANANSSGRWQFALSDFSGQDGGHRFAAGQHAADACRGGCCVPEVCGCEPECQCSAHGTAEKF